MSDSGAALRHLADRPSGDRGNLAGRGVGRENRLHPFRGAAEPVDQCDVWLPTEHAFGKGDIRASASGVTFGEVSVGKVYLDTRDPACASSSIVISFELPMFIGPTWSLQRRPRIPVTRSST